MSGGLSRGPDGDVLAAVEVLSLDDLVDGLVLADGIEGSQIEGLLAVDLRVGQAGDGNGGTAVTDNRVLQ